VPFDDYDGMTQQQYQDSVGPFLRHGKLVPIEVPKGWRRVESSRPGKHLYVHMASGAISRFPKEQFDCKQECWVGKDGTKLADEELKMHPERRVMKLVEPKVAEAALNAAAARKDAAEAAAAAPAPAVAEAPKQEAVAPAPEESVVSAQPPLPVALMFPGQGSQSVKMMSEAKDLPAVKSMLRRAEGILGYDILEICLQGPESKLEQTRYCQPAMYIGGLAGAEKLKSQQREKVERCQALAGLSLGEYTALTVAGVFDFETGLKIVKLRGEAMQEAAEASQQSMLSVAGLSQEKLSALCKECCEADSDVCQIANFLFPNGFSCAGTSAAVERLMAKAQSTEGCLQAKLLKTSGGFHTSLMLSAREKLLSALRDVEGDMKSPKCDVYMNLTGKKISKGTKPAEIIDMLGDQLISCVQWEPSIKEMIKDGVTEFYECGPMKQLKAMLKRIDANAFKAATSVDV